MVPLLVLVASNLMGLTASSSGQTHSVKWVPLAVDLPKGIQSAMPAGAKTATEVLHLSVALPYANPAGIKAYVDGVSDPKSPNYRHFLTPAQVGAKFGLPTSNVQQVADYLTSQGMKIRRVGQNRLTILADATVAQAQAAFNTSIEQFVPIANGVATGPTRFSFTTTPNLPASIASYVKFVGGMENFTRPKPMSSYTPDQFRTLYNLAAAYKSGFHGQGRTVAISNFDGYMLSNVPLQYAQFNLPAPSGGAGSNITVESINGENGDGNFAQGEGDVDIQTVLAMAPLCNLIVYDDAEDSDLISVLTQEADDNTADIVTESYGWNSGPAFNLAAHNLHLAMSAQGMTYMCASGDDGTFIEFYPYPDDDPEVLTVGGTSAGVDAAGNRLLEVGWANSGGGWSTTADPFNVLPSYQVGKGVPTGTPFRLVPDVALNANPYTGYDVFQNNTLEFGWGGTSCASPTFAGSLAVCEQQIIAGGGLPDNGAGVQRFGRIQDLLYSFNGDPGIFNDITQDSNGYLPDGNPSNAGPGWDTVTGWGTMNFAGFTARILGLNVLSSLSLNIPYGVGGYQALGTIAISSPAPAGGLLINLSSSSPSVNIQSQVFIPAGTTSNVFVATVTPVSTPTSVVVTATLGSSTLTTTVEVSPPGLASFTSGQTNFVGGQVIVFQIGLAGPAPTGGVVVHLSSNSSQVKVPATVTIPAKKVVASFSVTLPTVKTAEYVTLSATASGTYATETLTITPPTLDSILVSPTSVAGGTSAKATVNLTGKAPTGGLTVLLSSDHSDVTVPASVHVAAGASSATINVVTHPTTTTTKTLITAKLGIAFTNTTLTVTAPTLQHLSLSSLSVKASSKKTITGTVTISSPAPATGFTIDLRSSNTSAATVKNTVAIPAGRTQATFTITPKAVTATAQTVITVSTSLTSKTATLTVTP